MVKEDRLQNNEVNHIRAVRAALAFDSVYVETRFIVSQILIKNENKRSDEYESTDR